MWRIWLLLALLALLIWWLLRFIKGNNSQE